MTNVKKHEELLLETRKEYLEKGFIDAPKAIRKLFFGYRPDAVMESPNEIVVIEAIISHDDNHLLPEYINGKQITFVKRYSSWDNKAVTLNVDEDQLKLVDSLVGHWGFTDRSDVIRQAIKYFLIHNQTIKKKEE